MGDCRNCGHPEKKHANGKCLFEASEFSAPIEEAWLYDMANSPAHGMMVLRSPAGKTIYFWVELEHFSSTMGAPTPYFEFDLKGVAPINDPTK